MYPSKVPGTCLASRDILGIVIGMMRIMFGEISCASIGVQGSLGCHVVGWVAVKSWLLLQLYCQYFPSFQW
jgi:hypothetical protein